MTHQFNSKETSQNTNGTNSTHSTTHGDTHEQSANNNQEAAESRFRKNLQIGNVNVGVPILLAPMCGVSDSPFRDVVSSFGSNLTTSEMIASHATIRDIEQTARKTKKPEGRIMAVQLAGFEPKIMAEAAKINEDIGADIIDINFGCPVKKVVKGMAGSALMQNEDAATEILDAIVNAVKIPVTVKMRLGFSNDNHNAPSLAKKAESVGIKMVTVHGRTRAQMFTGKADWAAIANVKNAVNIPVIANGDIKTKAHALEAMQLSGADGVMIGRGAYGKPWVISQITNAILNGDENAPEPTNAEKLALIKTHILDIVDFYGLKTGIGFAKKHAMFYSKGLSGGAEFRGTIGDLNTAEDIVFGIEKMYAKIEEEMLNPII